MVTEHKRSKPPVGGAPKGPSNAAMLIASVTLVALLSFVLGYLTRGTDEEPTDEPVAAETPVVDTTAKPLDSGKIIESTRVSEPTPTPTPQFLFTKTLTEETAPQKEVPRSDALPQPTPEPKPKSTPKPTVKPTPKPTPAPTAEPKPKTTPKPIRTSGSIRSTPDTFYSVQVAAVGDRNEASRLRIDLGNKGFRSFVIPFMKDGQTFYRVRIGPFKTRGAAERTQKEVAAKTRFKKTLISADKR